MRIPSGKRHDDFIVALLEPASRQEECLLRTYLPEAAEAMSVDPYQPLAPRGHVDIGVARMLQTEVGTVVALLLGSFHMAVVARLHEAVVNGQ